MGELNKKQYLILFFLIVVVFLKTYSVHFNYPFPYHHDEWQHLALSIQAIEEGYNKQYNPYIEQTNYHADFESGFHFFLASFFLMTGLNKILFFQYFAAIFSVFSLLAIFLCTFKLSKKAELGFFSALIFIFLPTNVNILGKDYFVPLTMAIPFIFLFILYYLEAFKENNIKKFFLSLILLFALFVIHPPSFVILIFPAFIELLFNINFLKGLTRKNKIIIFILTFFLFIIALLLIWQGKIIDTLRYLKGIILFEKGWGRLEITYFIPMLYGLVNTIFAIIGVIVGRKSNFRFFISMAFFSLAITAIFNNFGFTLFVPYSRAVHYSMLAMIPLTALGLTSLLNYLIKKLDKQNSFSLRLTLSLFFTLLFLILLIFHNYPLDSKYRNYSYYVVDEEDYKALIWMKKTIGEDNLIVTPYFMTSAVYPVSGNKVISLIPAIMEGGLIEDNLNFYSYNCDKKKEILESIGAKYILSKMSLDCDFLEEIYSEGDFIYLIS